MVAAVLELFLELIERIYLTVAISPRSRPWRAVSYFGHGSMHNACPTNTLRPAPFQSVQSSSRAKQTDAILQYSKSRHTQVNSGSHIRRWTSLIGRPLKKQGRGLAKIAQVPIRPTRWFVASSVSPVNGRWLATRWRPTKLAVWTGL